MASSPVTSASDPDVRHGRANRPLKIVHYLPPIHLADGGVARTVLDLCIVFAQRGHQVTLLTFEGSEVPAEWLDEGAGIPRVKILPSKNSTRVSLGRHALTVCAESIRGADVVHLHAPWLAGNRQIARIARELNVPYVVTIHGMLDDWAMRQKAWKKKLYMLLFGRRFLNQASAVHATATAELQQSSKWFDNSNTPVLPCLIDLKPFSEMPGKELALTLLPQALREKKKILFLSRLHEKKGIDILIQSAALLRDRGADFILLIAGTGDPGYTQYLLDLTSRLKLNDRVMFLGMVTGDTKLSLYQSAELFVLPTSSENFGLVLVEAFASSLPVITTKGTDIWQEIQQAGAIIVDRDPSAFADSIADLLADQNKREVLGRRGREWALSTLSTEILAPKYEAMYRKSEELPKRQSLDRCCKNDQELAS